MGYADSQVENAYATCRRLARRHYENFPVASYLVPRQKRDALAAIYAFARCADDFADEGGGLGVTGPTPETRLRQLSDWRRKLGDCYLGSADQPVFVALADAARRFRLSRQHFEDLLCAFELDVRVNRHENFSALLGYCSYSANPVGRLVLELFGHRDPELIALSDNICTALQLTNFWQDVALDVARDRVYLPLEDLVRFDYSLDDLRAARTDARWRRLLALELERTREIFQRGRLLAERVTPSLRLQLRMTWLGGMKVLEKIEGVEYDVFRSRPSLGRWGFVELLVSAWRLRSSAAAG